MYIKSLSVNGSVFEKLDRINLFYLSDENINLLLVNIAKALGYLLNISPKSYSYYEDQNGDLVLSNYKNKLLDWSVEIYEEGSFSLLEREFQVGDSVVEYYYSILDEDKEKPAIVLIQELERYVELETQRDILYLLVNRYPNYQFLITTKSPWVIGDSCFPINLITKTSPGGKLREHLFELE